MKIIIIFLYMILGITNIYGQKEIPHETILDNPKAKITTIETKKQKEKATLNITVTKIKSKNINIEVNPNKKILLCNLNENNVKINKNEQVFFVENIQDIPTTSTINGERRLNHLRNQMLFRSAGVVADNELTYNSNPEENKDGHKVVQVEYKNEPKKLYMAVLDNTGALKSVYNAKFLQNASEVAIEKDITLNVWIFDKDIPDDTNMIFNYSNNFSGLILNRSKDKFNDPTATNSFLKDDPGSVFDFEGEPLNENFLPSTIVDGEKIQNVNSITSTSEDFFKDNREGIKVNTKYYTLVNNIYRNFSGIEINLVRNTEVVKAEKVSYIINVKNKNREIIERIHVNLYINSGKAITHFTTEGTLSSSNDIPNFWGNDNNSPIDRIIHLPTKGTGPIAGVVDLATKDLVFTKLSSYDVRNRNKTLPQSSFTDFQIKDNLNPIYTNNRGIINTYIHSINLLLLNTYYSHGKNVNEDIWFYPIEVSYCKGKKHFPLKFIFRVIKDFNFLEEDRSTDIYGVPILNQVIKGPAMNNESDYAYSNIITYTDYPLPFKMLSLIYEGQELMANYNNFLVNVPMRVGYNNFEFSADDKNQPRTFGIKITHYQPSKEKLVKKFRLEYITNDNEHIINHCSIIFKPFDSSWMYDDNKSTFKFKQYIRKEISEYLQKEKENQDMNISLGSVYFKNIDMSALFDSGTNYPQIRLYKNYVLINGNNTIPVNLHFKNTNENYINGKNKELTGDSIVLTIPKKYLKNLLINNKETTYTLKCNDTNNNNILKIGLDTSNSGNSFWKPLSADISITFLPFAPEKIILDYSDKIPLIKKEFNASIKSYDINYSIYNNNINLNQIFKKFTSSPYKYTMKVNNSPEKENQNIANCFDGNSIMITHKDTATILKLNKWNFKKSTENIILKYYNEEGENLYSYSDITVNLPDLDPYIYLDQNKTKLINYNKKTKEIRVERKKGCSRYLLGEVCLNSYDTEITKGKDDNIGIKLKTSENNEIFNGAFLSFEVNSHEYFDKGISKKIYLNIPNDLPENKDFEIISDLKDSNKASPLPNKYILAIGRKGFYKEIINKITLSKKSLLEGESTIEFKPDYPLESVKYFNSCTLDSPNKLSFVKGYNNISIKNNTGDGLVQINKNYKVSILINNQLAQDAIIRDLNSKNSFPINIDNIASLRFLINKNGNIGISLDKWDFNKNISNDTIDIKIYDESNKLICIHTFKVITPISFFKIIEKNPMDFGSIIQGQKNINGKGNILFETTPGTNIQVSLSNLDKNNSLKIKHEHSDILTVKDINSYTTSEGNNLYRTNVRGSLSVPEHQTIGNYKGKIMVNISIKQ